MDVLEELRRGRVQADVPNDPVCHDVALEERLHRLGELLASEIGLGGPARLSDDDLHLRLVHRLLDQDDGGGGGHSERSCQRYEPPLPPENAQVVS